MVRLCGVYLLVLLGMQLSLAQPSPWPRVEKEMKPWARWWWMGNAVDEYNLAKLMQSYAAAGIGGLEIAPIYGAKGYEDQYIPYLSPRWMEVLNYTVQQADSLDMGIDLTTGTGWPFGGPQVGVKEAATKMVFRTFQLTAVKPFEEKIRSADPKQESAPLLSLTAYDDEGNATLLTDRVAEDGTLDWKPTKGIWELYAIFEGKTHQQVKRAAPGGEGLTLNHFSHDALSHYLSRYDSAFAKQPQGIRAFYNDSYEVYGADWTAEFFDEFIKRRGYDLRLHIREFLGDESNDHVARLKSDYRQTMADLLLENFTQPWTKWAHGYGSVSKNQAHGSPGNLIDLYAAVDIPEVETFGSSSFAIPGLRRDSADVRSVDPDPIMLKFGSSAANVMGKKLVSSETFTWLTEHFKTSLSQCKPEVEQCFLAGVNHVFYHGITYSPAEAGWPGWLFYASVNFVPTNSWWPHLYGLNEYITRVQSVLQAGKPDNELLLYWPIHDNWDSANGRMMTFTVHNIDKWLHPTDFYKNVQRLQQEGYAYDFISDNLLSNAEVVDGLIRTSSNAIPYKMLIVPVTRKMPLETLEKLLDLVRQGATVLFQAVPQDVPGLGDYENRHLRFEALLKTIPFSPLEGGIKQASLGKGHILLSTDIVSTLQRHDIVGEQLVQHGLKFVRRKTTDGAYYFIVNHHATTIDTWVPFQSATDHDAMLLDPQNGRFGKVATQTTDGKRGVRIQLHPGEAVILKFYNKQDKHMPDWSYIGRNVAEINITDGWRIDFKEGGPQLPPPTEVGPLVPWTDFMDDAYQTFSGVGAYQVTFQLAKVTKDTYLLELEGVHESARVWINGQDAGLAWSIPYRLPIGHLLKKGKNTIRIEVANLMANRIRSMDRAGVEWRKYHEINFVNIDYKAFDASSWKVQPSGLTGTVKIKQYKME
ncbi:glycosyl hydrolase [Parapedobacter tibetensis]|uniref:glycosyl hydrolase n=1 Tax=Parapedobacter tibetensis TaxID=2972951 RepID=UPI00214DB3DF|nr:glycosyl hydrolase [Parapedobacter tibetensis]